MKWLAWRETLQRGNVHPLYLQSSRNHFLIIHQITEFFPSSEPEVSLDLEGLISPSEAHRKQNHPESPLYMFHPSAGYFSELPIISVTCVYKPLVGWFSSKLFSVSLSICSCCAVILYLCILFCGYFCPGISIHQGLFDHYWSDCRLHHGINRHLRCIYCMSPHMTVTKSMVTKNTHFNSDISLLF